ncbi:hypothetical protein GCM10025876_05390 [Demequina litorisediminis]|uniref:Uncharacterized protein n=1 Tax=Demequina litorisediminis TaxID=1849022 RepID=A0ABQ6IAF8_9MICO|nr:hypothetical protein GCM10025876_05390 [Demequina litorisediminis]
MPTACTSTNWGIGAWRHGRSPRWEYRPSLPTLESGHRAPTGVLVEARYYATYVLPWIGRRLTGRSSGDGRSAKFADWVRIDPS